jgi:hypothetical protein
MVPIGPVIPHLSPGFQRGIINMFCAGRKEKGSLKKIGKDRLPFCDTMIKITHHGFEFHPDPRGPAA